MKKYFKKIRTNRNPDIQTVPKKAIWPRRGALTWNNGAIGVAPSQSTSVVAPVLRYYTSGSCVAPSSSPQASPVAVARTKSKTSTILILNEQTPLKYDKETEF